MSGARDRFEHTRDCVKRLKEVQLLIMYECDDWQPPNVKAKGAISDPTATRAIAMVDELSVKLEALKQEESELESFIGESLAIINAVEIGLGEEYAIVLDSRYIDLWKWKDIAKLFTNAKNETVATRTVQNWAQIAFDWIDSVGISRLLKGDTEL